MGGLQTRRAALRRYVGLARQKTSTNRRTMPGFRMPWPGSWRLARFLPLRDPARAVLLAQQSVINAPKDDFQTTFGVAHHRAGNWKEAVAALEKSLAKNGSHTGVDCFFLAMAHWRLGEPGQARKYHAQAMEWMGKNDPDDDELRRFRAEADELLGIGKPPAEANSPSRP